MISRSEKNIGVGLPRLHTNLNPGLGRYGDARTHLRLLPRALLKYGAALVYIPVLGYVDDLVK